MCAMVYEQGRLNSAMSSLAADHDQEVCTAALAVSDRYKKVQRLCLFQPNFLDEYTEPLACRSAARAP